MYMYIRVDLFLYFVLCVCEVRSVHTSSYYVRIVLSFLYSCVLLRAYCFISFHNSMTLLDLLLSWVKFSRKKEAVCSCYLALFLVSLSLCSWLILWLFEYGIRDINRSVTESSEIFKEEGSGGKFFV